MTAPSAVLFLALLASQSAVLVLTPILVEVAHDLDVSTAAAGQLRSVTGLVAGLVALAFGVGVAVLVSAGAAAAGEWVAVPSSRSRSAGRRRRLLSPVGDG